MKKSILFLILPVLCIRLAAETGGVLIIYPLEADGLVPELAAAADSVFEQSLIKTGEYQIINVKDFELLLQAQGFMLSGLFDDSRVVTIGRLLPAEFIARGSIKALVQGVAVHLKILDLASGEVLRSESETGIDPAELEPVIQRMVFRLTGRPQQALTGTGSSAYYALTVTADRDGSGVYLDSRQYGTTPLVIDNVPAGISFLEIKKGSLYYAEQLNLESDTAVYGTLKQRTGNIIIRTRPEGAFVTVGDTGYGQLRFIDNLPAEVQPVTLKSPGFFWQGEVPVVAEKTVTIDIDLLPTSTVTVQADDDVVSNFYGNDLLADFRGTWQQDNLPPGTYMLELHKPGYRDYKEEIRVGVDEHIIISPQMILNEESLAALEVQQAERDRIRDALAAITLPAIYLEHDIPRLDLLAMKNTFLALVPGLDLFILFDKPLVPDDMQPKIKTTTAVQFGAGLLFQLGLAGYFLFDDEAVSTGSLIAAAVAGGVNLGLGIYASAGWGSWSDGMQAEKKQYEVLKKQQRALLEASAVD